jgi:hypothetical protein
MLCRVPLGGPLSNYPFKDPITIKRVDADDLDALLGGFEKAWADSHDGDRLTSAEFYERYASGEVDSIFAVSWATYYEAACEIRRRRELHVSSLPEALLAGG